MALPRKFDAPSNLDGQGRPTDPHEERQCAYVSVQHGRCRYWGTISRGGGQRAVCAVHYRSEAGAAAEQAVEASLGWRRAFWNLRTGALEPSDRDEAGELERRAREVAVSVGVNPDAPARLRAMAISRRVLAGPRSSAAGPNLRHMRALLDAVESGHPERWSQHPISAEEIAAARRATGRLRERVPGEDDEEDGSIAPGVTEVANPRSPGAGSDARPTDADYSPVRGESSLLKAQRGQK